MKKKYKEQQKIDSEKRSQNGKESDLRKSVLILYSYKIRRKKQMWILRKDRFVFKQNSLPFRKQRFFLS